MPFRTARPCPTHNTRITRSLSYTLNTHLLSLFLLSVNHFHLCLLRGETLSCPQTHSLPDLSAHSRCHILTLFGGLHPQQVTIEGLNYCLLRRGQYLFCFFPHIAEGLSFLRNSEMDPQSTLHVDCSHLTWKWYQLAGNCAFNCFRQCWCEKIWLLICFVLLGFFF